MVRVAAALAFLLLTLAASAPAIADAAPVGGGAEEALSRAQVVQMIADHGYFEMADLRRLPDGRWSCTALAGPGRRCDGQIRQYHAIRRAAEQQAIRGGAGRGLYAGLGGDRSGPRLVGECGARLYLSDGAQAL
jgi:hypothetical protein